MSADDFDDAVGAYRHALGAFVKGDPLPVLDLFSRRDDVTLANPLGPPQLGFANIERASTEAARTVKNGSIHFEEISRFVTPELGYVLDVERVEAQVGGGTEMSPISLRVTTIFRREGDGWKVVHRHADPITTPRDIASVIDQP